MCGRFTLDPEPEEIARIFSLSFEEALRVLVDGKRFNIAPTNQVAAVRLARVGISREPVLLRWGLVPAWAKDPSLGVRMINARAETVAEKPAYRSAFKSRRCLILADGFYEWQKTAGGKQPHLFRLTDGAPFAFAGLWESWGKEPDGFESCTIITTEPNELVSKVHNRMPVILRREDYDRWLLPLDKGDDASATLSPLLKAYPAESMVGYPVSTFVNKPGNDTAVCVEPVGPQLVA